jgi:Bacterial SH3 domain
VKNILSIAFLSLIMIGSTQVTAFSSPKADGYYQCTVKDPTGVPLNVRKTPGGKVITSIVNGTRVGLVSREDSGKWKQIMVGSQEDSNVIYGWVVKKYLVNCSSQ